MTVGLLPQGFYDELYPNAAKRMQTIYELLQFVNKAGYELVDPPLVEFEDTLFEGAGDALVDETFRVMDPKSHRMMGIRADMTVQVARIAATRLKADKRPIRVSYAGQVLKVKGDALYGHRQLWQTGIELVGDDTVTSEIEILDVAISALKKQGIKDICVDFTIPKLAPQSINIEFFGCFDVR
jgi:ATP phosphoribosyltransferase regulatory subunit